MEQPGLFSAAIAASTQASASAERPSGAANGASDRSRSAVLLSPYRVASTSASPLTPSRTSSLALRVRPGQELLDVLCQTVLRLRLRAAFVQTCVGSARRVVLRLAGATPATRDETIEMREPFEIVSLTGTLACVPDDGEEDGMRCAKHLHVALADSKGRVIGGHLVQLEVETTAEVVLGELEDVSFSRQLDTATGFPELVVSRR